MAMTPKEYNEWFYEIETEDYIDNEYYKEVETNGTNNKGSVY